MGQKLFKLNVTNKKKSDSCKKCLVVTVKGSKATYM